MSTSCPQQHDCTILVQPPERAQKGQILRPRLVITAPPNSSWRRYVKVGLAAQNSSGSWTKIEEAIQGGGRQSRGRIEELQMETIQTGFPLPAELVGNVFAQFPRLVINRTGRFCLAIQVLYLGTPSDPKGTLFAPFLSRPIEVVEAPVPPHRPCKTHLPAPPPPYVERGDSDVEANRRIMILADDEGRFIYSQPPC